MSNPKSTLLNLPGPPAYLLTCNKCGNTGSDGWMSRDWGCYKCSPEDEAKSREAAADGGTRPS